MRVSEIRRRRRRLKNLNRIITYNKYQLIISNSIEQLFEQFKTENFLITIFYFNYCNRNLVKKVLDDLIWMVLLGQYLKRLSGSRVRIMQISNFCLKQVKREMI